MKGFLLYADHGVDWEEKIAPESVQTVHDLNLDVLCEAMAQGDNLLYLAAERMLLHAELTVSEVQFRQAVLQDCLNHAPFVAELYVLVKKAIEDREAAHVGMFARHRESMLHEYVPVLEILFDHLQHLRDFVLQPSHQFQSEGFRGLVQTLKHELDDPYLTKVRQHLVALRFKRGMVFSATLGRGHQGQHYRAHPVSAEVIHKPRWRLEWFQKRPISGDTTLSVVISELDENGQAALVELKDRGLSALTKVVIRALDQVVAFLKRLQMELAFYLACIHLSERLHQIGGAWVFPAVASTEEGVRQFLGAYDLCLALQTQAPVVASDLDANGKNLIIITGANQGGKSTFLRSLGLCQLMLNAGMFVPASNARASLTSGVYTHFGRPEDRTMERGKLDEELKRCRDLVQRLKPYGLVLFNEAFSSTNEREGAEIARQVTQALIESHIQVAMVTHLYAFARPWCEQNDPRVLCLRAGRLDDGTRTFEMTVGPPAVTSFGGDLLQKMKMAQRERG